MFQNRLKTYNGIEKSLLRPFDRYMVYITLILLIQIKSHVKILSHCYGFEKCNGEYAECVLLKNKIYNRALVILVYREIKEV